MFDHDDGAVAELDHQAMHARSYEESKRCVKQHFLVFERLVARANKSLYMGQYDAAAVYAEIAANYAMSHHTGLFTSPQLEHVLLTLGGRITQGHSSSTTRIALNENPKHVLHVLTQAAGIGGDTRFIWRWITQDKERTHSVVLTRQGSLGVPQPLKNAVNYTHGKIHILNEHRGSLLSWAKMLRDIAASTDLVVLHVHPYDIIPVLAFANKEGTPPVVFVDLADQVFWVGASISDVVVNLRESGSLLARQRRGIETSRCILLPTGLGQIKRTLTRPQAKQQLGLSQDTVLMLSIARPHKYRPIDEEQPSFVDALVPVIKEYDHAMLVVIGPDHTDEWIAAEQDTQGRVKAIGKREDTAVFYQAADIYVDSFLIVSITSLLEAGSYGIPLVSRCPALEVSSVLCADAPGLAQTLMRVHDLREYQSILSRLIEDEGLRLQVGEQTQRDITEIHSGTQWSQYLRNIYFHAATVSQVSPRQSSQDQPCIGELDVLLPRIFKGEPELDEIIQFHLRLLPLDLRLRLWMKMVQEKRAFLPGLLLPEWIGTRLEKGRLLLRQA